ncbi:MAG: sensor domain-containing protein [Nocardioides sp.]|nr:sensor domain-containing protein [Nocardioides sp.]
MTSTIEMRHDPRALPEPEMTMDRPTWWRRIGRDTTYNLTALAFAVPVFVVTVVGLALGTALLVLLFGIPILAGTMYAARGFAHIERVRIETLLADRAPTPEHLGSNREGSWLVRAATPLRDPQSWFDLIWALASFVTSIVVFVVTVAWWAVALGGLSYWYWEQFIAYEKGDNVLLVEVLNLGEGRGAESWLMLGFGVFALLTLPLALRACARAQGGLGRSLLSSRA